MGAAPSRDGKVSARAHAALIVLAYLAFVSLGLPDAVIGVAWPSLRETFGLSQPMLGVVLALGAAAYFVSGLFAGRLQQGFGIGALLAASTALVAAGVFGYAWAPAFFVIALIAPLIGFGSGAIDSALNTYAAKHFRPRQMTWLHAAYAAGAMAGPALMTAAYSRGAGWRTGYATVGVLLASLVLAFVLTRRWWDRTRVSAADLRMDAAVATGPLTPPVPRATAWSALRNGRVWLQITLFFLYTGLEVSAGQWSYTILTEGRGVGTVAAGGQVASYWGGLLAGRVALGFVVERIGQVFLVRLAMAGVVIFAGLLAFPSGGTATLALPLLSFSLAAIYPGLMSETPRRVGEETAAHAVGFQVSAATLGVAVVPTVAGLAGERLGLESITWLLAAVAVLLLVLHEVLLAVTRPRAAEETATHRAK